jgi:hypothetical protein
MVRARPFGRRLWRRQSAHGLFIEPIDEITPAIFRAGELLLTIKKPKEFRVEIGDSAGFTGLRTCHLLDAATGQSLGQAQSSFQEI